MKGNRAISQIPNSELLELHGEAAKKGFNVPWGANLKKYLEDLSM